MKLQARFHQLHSITIILHGTAHLLTNKCGLNFPKDQVIILIIILYFALFIELSNLMQVSICLPAPKGRCLSPEPFFFLCRVPSSATGALLISAM